MKIPVPEMTCARCRHTWVPRTSDVRICPKCKSVRWDPVETMSQQPIDPAMEPQADSTIWFETGPDPIRHDPAMATLMVRVGMASNALSAQFHAGEDARHRRGAARTRDILSSFVTAAAVTHESIQLARSGMARLRPLALRAGAKEELLARVGKLCAGKHPSAAVLDRARNQVGFHWDEAVVGQSVLEYARNQKIVWLESDASFHPVHRFAVDVLGHALFPDAGNELDSAISQQTISNAMAKVDDAMRLIIEFFTAALYGYMRTVSADRRERSDRPNRPQSRQRKRVASH